MRRGTRFSELSVAVMVFTVAGCASHVHSWDGGGRGGAGAGAGGRSGGSAGGGSAGGGGDDSGAPGDAVPGDPPFTNPVYLPPVLQPTSTDGSTDFYALTVKPGKAQMKSGSATPIVGFNGMFPGPTIIATRGRAVQVTQTNGWTENITIHNHGHKVAADSDGHPTDYIVPGASKVYNYPNDQRAATYWYHDHTMDLTGSHVYQGLAAFYVIHDPTEDALNLPSGSYDIPLLIQDKSFNADNSLAYNSPNIFRGQLGDTAVVNGVATPYLDVSTRKYRLRLLNGSNSRPLTIQLQVGGGAAETFQVIASDGGLLQAPVSVTSLSMAPAERYDIIVDFARYPIGTKLTMINTDTTADGNGNGGGGPSLTQIMQLVIAHQENDTSTVPATLSGITRLAPAQAASTQNITFNFSSNDWTMNGLNYDPARIDETSKLGTVYIWALDNQTGIMHPFHKHLAQFNILDINGQPPPAYAAGWKDTVQVPAKGTAHIIFKDETFTGTYVFHCHKLEHEDHRMMLQEQVTP